MEQPSIQSTNPDYLVGIDGGHLVRVPVNAPDGQRANIGLSQAQQTAGASGVSGATAGGSLVVGSVVKTDAQAPDALAIKGLGIRADSTGTLTAQESWLGAAVDHLIAFAETSNAANPWSTNLTDTQSFITTFGASNRDIKWAVPICTGTQPIDETIAGAHDAIIRLIAQAISSAATGPVIDIRPGWEPNFSTSYPWGSTLVTTAQYIAAFRRVVNLFRSVDRRFRVTFCASTRVDAAWPFEGMYPGDDYVDIVGVDAYLLTGDKGAMTDAEHVEFMFSGPCGINRFRTFAAQRGKMLAICEWGTNYDNPGYVERIADFVRQHNVAYHAYWDQNNGAFTCKLSADQWPNSAYSFVRNFGPFHIDTWGITATPGTPLNGLIACSKPVSRLEVLAGGAAYVSDFNRITAPPQFSGSRRVSLKAYDERGLSATRSIVLTWQNGRLWTPAELGASLGDWLSVDFSGNLQRHILAVKTITSLVGTARTATAQTAAQRPTYGYFSGIPAATLDGGDALVQSDVTGVPAAQAAVTYATCAFTDSAAGNFTYLVMDSDANAGVRGIGVNGGNLRIGAAGGIAGGSITNATRSIVASFGAGASAAIRATIDGGTATTGNVAIGVATYTRRVIGANAGASNAIGSYYLGRLYEFFCANVAMNTTQEDQSHGYFAWKYGLEGQLPGGHPYKSSPPVV